MSSTRQPSDQAARILMKEIINSNYGGFFTFHLILSSHHLLPPASAPSSSPHNLAKNPNSKLVSHLRTQAMASSSSTPSMTVSGEATAKPVSSIVVPPKGLVIPVSAVVET